MSAARFSFRLFAFALAVEARQVLGARRVDPALFGHPRQHLGVALAVVAPHDRAQRRIGLHRRAVDANPLALHQAVLGDYLQNPAEHLLVRLVRQTRARARQPRMIGNLVAVRQPQEIAQRERVRATPRNAALAVDPLGQGTPREAAEAAYAFIFTLRTETVLVFGMIAVVEGEFAALVLIAAAPTSS